MTVERIEGLFLTYFLRTSFSCILNLFLALFFFKSANNYKHFLLVLFVQNFTVVYYQILCRKYLTLLILHMQKTRK